MSRVPRPSIEHLYVHVPFCRRRCSYCDFAIAVRKSVPVEQFVDRVTSELERRQSKWDAELRSIYFGGGTPSLLHGDALRSIVDRIGTAWHSRDDIEVTVEANPDDVTEVVIDAWVQAGINRVSLGVQSLEPETLKWMHRTHTVQDTERALDLLGASGIRSVSVDVIFGLPAHAKGDPVANVARLVDHTAISHLSCYGLTVESGTPLSKWQGRGQIVEADETRYASEFTQIHDLLSRSGFLHYEVSSYALPDHRSVHNRGYWNGAGYLGVGPSAHSFVEDERWWNVRNWTDYDRLVAAGTDPREGGERLDRPSRWLETLYLGLRTSDGLSEAVARFLPPDPVKRLVRDGFLAVSDGGVKATPEGWLKLDEIVAVLATSSEGG